MGFIKEYLKMMWDATVTFVGNPFIGILFILAVIVILFLEEKKEKKYIMIGYSVIVVVALYNPITYLLCKAVFGSTLAYYCRLFSLIPLGMVVAYAIAILLKRTKGAIKAGIVVVLTALIILLGNNVYQEDWIQRAVNSDKLSNDVIQICNLLNNDAGKFTLAVPTELAPYIRQYDASIVMPYGRWKKSSLKEELTKENPDANITIQYALKAGCDYVVIKRNETNVDNFEKLNTVRFFGESDNYYIIEITNAERVKKEYNSQGQLIREININSDNEISENEYGYAIIEYKYDAMNYWTEKCFCDSNGNLVNTKEGYAKISREYNKKGNTTKEIFFNINGEKCSIIKGYTSVHYEYDERGRKIKETYYDIEDNICLCDKGYAAYRYTYGENKKVSRIDYYGIDNQLIERPEGHASVEKFYDEEKRVIKEVYYDSKGNPVNYKGKYSVVEYKYTEDGKKRIAAKQKV